MRLWSREIAGWLLMLLGIYVFYICFDLLTRRYVVETGPLVVIGIVLFRGGVHLLKVAVAAQVCHAAQASAGDLGTAPQQPKRDVGRGRAVAREKLAAR